MTMCEYYGHTWIQESWGTNTDPQQQIIGPVRCLNCGAVQSSDLKETK